MQNLLEQKWHTVGHPWGDGIWAVAGHPDPHAGKFVFDCENIVDDFESIHEVEEAKEMAASVAAHIVKLHNNAL